jgi:uncharacterized membrane protein
VKKFLRAIKPIIVGGLFFLAPIVILAIVLEKAYAFTQRLIDPLINTEQDLAVGGVAIRQIIGIVVLLIICFLAGLLAKTKMIRRFISWAEGSIMGLIPGYQFLKSMGQTMAGIEQQDMQVVLARVDDGWQISFLIEKIDDDMYTVFVPASPNPMSGSVYHVEKDKIKWIDMTQKQAIKCIRQLGFGSADVLRNKFNEKVELSAESTQEKNKT